ncbi:hypothetical protein BZA77DRAFT_78156 [Pyronema omphalodes]|nr:hypothetical protein BZA77DRAFT_78156 [Pyronema omphalodes]
MPHKMSPSALPASEILPDESTLFGRNNCQAKRTSKKRPRGRKTTKTATLEVVVSEIIPLPATITPYIIAADSEESYRKAQPPRARKGNKAKKRGGNKKEMTPNINKSHEAPDDGSKNGNQVPSQTEVLDSVKVVYGGPTTVVTLVKSKFIRHIRGDLPEPLRSGFKEWSESTKNGPQTFFRRIYHNRLLKFWRDATDKTRFEREDHNEILALSATYRQLEKEDFPEPGCVYPLQRPYSAPPHFVREDMEELRKQYRTRFQTNT